MQLLFLDVDGVLNNSKREGVFDLDDQNISVLKKIIFHFNFDLIILTSDWRIGGENAKQMKILRSRLRKEGIEINSVTRCLDMSRGKEIQVWLTDNHFGSYFTDFLIIDDFDDFLDFQKANLILIDSTKGIQENDFDRLLVWKTHKR